MFGVKCRKNCASKYRLILFLLLIGSKIKVGEIFRPIVEQIAYFSLSAVRRDKRKDRKGAASANLGRATIDRVPVKECSKVVANLFDREFFVHWNAIII